MAYTYLTMTQTFLYSNDHNAGTSKAPKKLIPAQRTLLDTPQHPPALRNSGTSTRRKQTKKNYCTPLYSGEFPSGPIGAARRGAFLPRELLIKVRGKWRQESVHRVIFNDDSVDRFSSSSSVGVRRQNIDFGSIFLRIQKTLWYCPSTESNISRVVCGQA